MSNCVCLPKDATIELIDANLGEKTITENGRYLASSDDLDGYSAVDVNVSQSFTQEDEGKVVSNGSLVSQTSATYTENGTYDTTLVDDVTVNVPSMPYLEYWGDISVLRQGGYVQPTFPVVAGRCIVAFCPDEKEESTKEYVMLFATYNAEGTKYSYGALSEEDGRSIQTNYVVTEGAEYMTPARYVAFPGWMEDHTLTAPAYIIVNSKKDED